MQKIKMDQSERGSFTVTLQSNLCKEEYPHNNNYKFKNRLPHEVDVKDFEVGLVDLYHYDTYQRPLSKDEYQIKNSDNTPFFDLLFSENEITIIDSVSVNMQALKFTENLSGWLIKFNEFLQSNKFFTHIVCIRRRSFKKCHYSI